MSRSATVRPVACARAEAYGALALVLRPPTLCWCRGLRRVTTALARVMIWHPQPLLEDQVVALRRWLQEPSIEATGEHRRLFGASGAQTLIEDLERMAVLCTREARAWETNDGAAARGYLLEQHSHLRSLDRSLSGIAEVAVGEGLYAILARIAWQYVVLDERLVTTLLVAAEYAPSVV